jgi:5,10-methylene-tetrahydrofolate dehydrogenase/methenyl tetrahydrofolate cyclohydrolase
VQYLSTNELVAGYTGQQTEQFDALLERGVVPHMAILRDVVEGDKRVGANERGVRSYTGALLAQIGQYAGETIQLDRLVSVTTVHPAALDASIELINDNPLVHGGLLMSPKAEKYEDGKGELVEAEKYDAIVSKLDIAKDVDRMSPLTREHLASQGQSASPATPQAVHKLLDHVGLWTPDLSYTLVGKGRTVGRFVYDDLQALHGVRADENVHLITNSNKGDLPEAIKASQVVIVAAGEHHQIRPEYIHDGVLAVVGVCIEDIHPEVYENPRDDLLVTPIHLDPDNRGLGALTSVLAWGNTLDAAALAYAPDLARAA